MASYGNLSLSELIVYNSAGDASANLQFDNNNSDGNFAMNKGLDINGSLDVNGNLNIAPTYELNVGSSANASTTNLYGNLNLLNLSTSNATISFGQYGAPGLSYNNLSDGNLYMNTGLDINGNLVFSQQTATSTAEQFKGIQLNYSAQGSYLCFPYANTNGSSMNTNAFSPPSETTPIGLGIIWDNTSNQGEVDLIGYGGGSSTSGGITIYGYNTTSGETRIADFWPGGSTIYTSLDVSGNNLTLSNSSSSVSLNAYNANNIIDYLSVGGSGILISGTGQYGFATSSGVFPILSYGGNSFGSTEFYMNYGLFLNGTLTFTTSSPYYGLGLNSSNNNININTGLDVEGNLSIGNTGTNITQINTNQIIYSGGTVSNTTQTITVNPGAGFISITEYDYAFSALYSYICVNQSGTFNFTSNASSVQTLSGSGQYNLGVNISGTTISLTFNGNLSDNITVNIISF